MTKKVRDVLTSFNIPLTSYNDVFSDFDNTCTYLHDMLIFISSEAKKSKSLLYDA